MFTLCQAWLHYNNKNIDSFLKYFSLVGEADTHTAEACQCKEGGGDSPRGLPGEEDTGAEFGKTNENLTGRWGVRERAGEMPGLIQNRIKMPVYCFCSSLPSGHPAISKRILTVSYKHPGSTWKSLGPGKEGT